MVMLLSNEEIKQILDMKLCLDILEDAYRKNGLGQAISPPIIQTLTPVDIPYPDTSPPIFHSMRSMPGAIRKDGVASIRIDSDIVHWPVVGGQRRRVKIPAAPGGGYVGLILLFSAKTGEPLAILPDGYIQGMRVGGTCGLGVKYLARPDSRICALYGSGWQAKTHLLAVDAAVQLEEIRIFSPSAQNREKFVAEMQPLVRARLKGCGDGASAAKGADILVCATNSLAPVIESSWIQPGMHLGTVRDLEIGVEGIRRCDVIVLSRKDPLWNDYTMEGEEANAVEFYGGGKNTTEIWGREIPGIAWDCLPTLGEVIVGRKPGRRDTKQVTYFLAKGDGLQLTAVAYRIYQEAQNRGMGRDLPVDWFTQDYHP